MISGHVFIGVSVDGYIARPDGGIDWLAAVEREDEDYGYARFGAGMDGVVMGRSTFETVLGFGAWPYERPVVVLSHSLVDLPVPEGLEGRLSFSDATPAALFDTLSARGWRRVWVDGGRVVQSFLRAGLISEMTLSRIPVLIGAGIPLFGPLSGDLRLEHQETRAFPSGLVQSRYRCSV
ncbi:dihydrofolate reductase [Paroceanicella profunda]|uniref:Dihydrofolate reductase n=1 Tax=Paroceanicella profunda TaxID=2579971 RepID=A0A5B8G006_9RHOB|nr:dihydrofolate reductase family protein [Paroceanicella profunda]QDL92359.1 dihydrofolate reductase [Paroceanicella profunda]